MARATIEVLVDDLDGSEGSETVRLGWNGEWRELDLSKRNLASLARALDKYWDVARPVTNGGRAAHRTRRAPRKSRRASRDPKVIRAWAIDRGIEVPSRGRIPAEVERQFNDANGHS